MVGASDQAALYGEFAGEPSAARAPTATSSGDRGDSP